VRDIRKEDKNAEYAYNDGTNIVIGLERIFKGLQHNTANTFAPAKAISTLIKCERLSFI